jgi:hypothetical protein
MNRAEILVVLVGLLLVGCGESGEKSSKVVPAAPSFSQTEQTPCEKAKNCRSYKQVLDERKEMQTGK